MAQGSQPLMLLYEDQSHLADALSTWSSVAGCQTPLTEQVLTRVLAQYVVSVGEEDHLRKAVLAEGWLDFWTQAIKPGKLFVFGWLRRANGSRVLYLGLPGNPVASLVTILLLARHLVRWLGRPAVTCSRESGQPPALVVLIRAFATCAGRASALSAR